MAVHTSRKIIFAFKICHLAPSRGPVAKPRMLVSNREIGLRMTEQQKHRARIVRKAIETIEAKLEESEIRPTLADLVKLLQIEKELEADEPREVRVRWVESDTSESSSKQ